MKLHISFLNLVLILGIFLTVSVGCKKKDAPKPTIQEILALNGKPWKINRLTVGGAVDAAAPSSGYTIAFTLQGTYNVNLGSLAAKLSPAINPNRTGNWILDNTLTKVIFDPSTNNANEVTLVEEPTTTKVVFSWNILERLDKNKPAVIMELVPAQ